MADELRPEVKPLPKVDAQGRPLPERGTPGSASGAYRKESAKERKKTGVKRRPGAHGSAPRSYDRLKRVQDLLTLCYTTAEIRHTLAEEWNVSPETISKYIQEVYKIWKRDARPTEDERNRTSESLARVFQTALKDKQHGVALQAMKIRAQVLGLFQEKITVNQVAVAVHQAAAARVDVAELSESTLAELSRMADKQMLLTESRDSVIGDAQVIDKKVD